MLSTHGLSFSSGQSPGTCTPAAAATEPSATLSTTARMRRRPDTTMPRDSPRSIHKPHFSQPSAPASSSPGAMPPFCSFRGDSDTSVPAVGPSPCSSRGLACSSGLGALRSVSKAMPHSPHVKRIRTAPPLPCLRPLSEDPHPLQSVSGAGSARPASPSSSPPPKCCCTGRFIASSSSSDSSTPTTSDGGDA